MSHILVGSIYSDCIKRRIELNIGIDIMPYISDTTNKDNTDYVTMKVIDNNEYYEFNLIIYSTTIINSNTYIDVIIDNIAQFDINTDWAPFVNDRSRYTKISCKWLGY
jgi:hypothetical protein